MILTYTKRNIYPYYVFMFLITFLLFYFSTFETKQLSYISLHFIVNT